MFSMVSTEAMREMFSVIEGLDFRCLVVVVVIAAVDAVVVVAVIAVVIVVVVAVVVVAFPDGSVDIAGDSAASNTTEDILSA